MGGLLELYRGDQPLRRALWVYALAWGTLANLVALLASMAAFAADAPQWLALALFLLPLPYVLLATIGVWRSAGAPSVPARQGTAARLLVSAWALAMLLL